jgi:hypothetical protein
MGVMGQSGLFRNYTAKSFNPILCDVDKVQVNLRIYPDKPETTTAVHHLVGYVLAQETDSFMLYHCVKNHFTTNTKNDDDDDDHYYFVRTLNFFF